MARSCWPRKDWWCRWPEGAGRLGFCHGLPDAMAADRFEFCALKSV